MTSFYARALSQRQKFETIEEFFQAAEGGKLKRDQQDWLPPSLLAHALSLAPQVGERSLEKKGAQRVIVCKLADGTVIEGGFRIDGGRVKSVTAAPRQRP